MNKLLCVRHGETDWNVKKLMQGRMDISLNDKGINQAYALKNNIGLYNIDLCFCSPLIRARQTAEILTGTTIPIIFDESIEERSFGDFEGKTYTDDIVKMHWDLNLNYSDNNVESLNDTLTRARNFINKINDLYDNKTILVVSHACFIKCLYFVINGYDKNTDFLSFFPKNGEVYEFSLNNRVRNRV